MLGQGIIGPEIAVEERVGFLLDERFKEWEKIVRSVISKVAQIYFRPIGSANAAERPAEGSAKTTLRHFLNTLGDEDRLAALANKFVARGMAIIAISAFQFISVRRRRSRQRK